MSHIKLLIDAISDFIIILDSTGRFIEANDAARQLKGLKQVDFQALSFLTLRQLLSLPWESFAFFGESAENLFLQAERKKMDKSEILWEGRLAQEKPKQYWLIGRKNHKLLGEQESSSSIFSQTLQHNKLTPELIIKSLPGHVYWKDLKGHYIGCNQSQAEFYGLSSPEEIYKKSDHDFFPDSDVEKIREIDETVVREQKSYCIEETTREAIHDKEKQRVFLSNKAPLKDLTGNIIGILGISFDITERKRIEQSMRRMQEKMRKDAEIQKDYLARLTEEVTGMETNPNIPAYVHAEIMRNFLEEIIAHMPGHVYWYDRNNVFLGCNENQAISAGLKSRREIVGKTNFDMPWKQHAEELNEVNQLVLKTGKAYKAEELSDIYIPEKGEKELRIFLSQKVPLYNKHGEIIGVLGVSFDITEEKRIENELAKQKDLAEMANKAKTEFLANMSHEVRTPLNAIVGMAQILEVELTDSKNKEYVDIIYKSGLSLAQLIEDILDYSKLDAGKLVLCLESFNLHTLATEVIESLNYRAKEKSLNLSLNYHPKTPRIVTGDPKRLRQILVNLTNNALKFTEKGGVVISISFEKKKKEAKGYFKISVKDTGIGIDSEHLTSIFDRFSQVSSSYHSKYDGVGLGLAITKQLVTIMGGEVGVHSKLREGSEFYCYLPLEVRSEENVTEENIAPLPPLSLPEENNRPVIFVIEDNLLNQMVLRLMLEEIGCDVVIADTGEKGLDLLAQYQPDILCVDIGLPDIDGLEITKQIRASEKSGGHLPILAITAHVLSEEKACCYAAGVDAVISKPVMRHELRTVVEKWLNVREKENSRRR